MREKYTRAMMESRMRFIRGKKIEASDVSWFLIVRGSHVMYLK